MDSNCIRRPADWKSAIQQVGNPRYFPKTLNTNSRSLLPVSRRTFLRQAAIASAAASGGVLPANPAEGTQPAKDDGKKIPWFRRALRWGQTNITELDITRYDIPWWREYWKRTRVQGVIINAGGIVAYYPTHIPYHKRAQFLGERDLFGELVHAAHEDGLAVLARMDSGGAGEEFYQAHPDWFALDAAGKPQRSRGLYVGCVNGSYYRDYIPVVMKEIAKRYSPEGFTDNSWSGPGRANTCYCKNCEQAFLARSKKPLPRTVDWDDPGYREWIEWCYQTRLEIWDLNNSVTKAAGGEHCLWLGMNGGSIPGQCQSFRDYKAICERSEILMLDYQSRGDSSGFQNNGETGKFIHGLLGWDKLIPESMAMYQAGRPTFRMTAKPAVGARFWMLDGIAGGIQPWWHHLGAFQEDRRAFDTAEPVTRWHEANQQYLVNRAPIATVGVVWSQRNTDFYGRDDADLLVEQPGRGITQSLIKARIPYLPVHADHLQRDSAMFDLLILPNLALLNNSQIEAIRAHVKRGGGLLATGESSLCNPWGEPRPDFALADLFGAHYDGKRAANKDNTKRRAASETQHTYLRIGDPGNKSATDRHEVLQGFEKTDLLPFGGALDALRLDPSAKVILTFVPAFPVFPPESVWMREPKTDIPGLILNEPSDRGRVVFMPADLDRRFARDYLPDHATLIANLVRWAARRPMPLLVEGPGFLDCHLYYQPGRCILHIVNLSGAAFSRAPVDELTPIGPVRIKIKLPKDVRGHSVHHLVAGSKSWSHVENGWSGFDIRSIRDHEVSVIS
jgi:hypothetical protein